MILAWNSAMAINKIVSIFSYLIGDRQLALWYLLPFLIFYYPVQTLRQVQDHRIVGLVGMMPMPLPFIGRAMDLYISGPELITDFHLGIKEIGPCMQIVYSRINHL